MHIGPFEVSINLGKGGMANVFLGKRPGSRALVVVKLLNEKSRDKESVAKLFLAEGRIMSGLHHPNVVRIIEHGFHQDQPYIAMEYLAGDHVGAFIKTLRKQGKLTDPSVAAHMFYQVAKGLAYCHETKDEAGKKLGLVHRDISPQNIFVCLDGNIKILDFGVAKATQHASHEKPGKLMGKIGYMSPEQVLDKPLTPQSDIFSLGIVMWEMMTAKLLFKRKTQLESLKAICQKDAVPITNYAKDLPKELTYIIMRCLKREASERFSDAFELQRALADFSASRAGRLNEEQYKQIVLDTLGPLEKKREKIIRAKLLGDPLETFDDLSQSDEGLVTWDDTSFSLPPTIERLPDLGEITGLSDGDPVMALREAINKGAPQLTLQAYKRATTGGQLPNLDARLALKLADILERENLALDAARMCRVAAEKDLNGPLAPEAIMRGAEILLGPANKQEPGLAMLRFLMQRFPGHPLAIKAIKRLRGVYDGSDDGKPDHRPITLTRPPPVRRLGIRWGRALYTTLAGLLLLVLLAFLTYLIFPEHRHLLGFDRPPIIAPKAVAASKPDHKAIPEPL
ncbi:MAG: serine/threonine protein kinase [Deltaproteobacteria bacterium]|nr:serine/threonine protein kinase [Deltaproteobacteria bacterium]